MNVCNEGTTDGNAQGHAASHGRGERNGPGERSNNDEGRLPSTRSINKLQAGSVALAVAGFGSVCLAQAAVIAPVTDIVDVGQSAEAIGAVTGTGLLAALGVGIPILVGKIVFFRVMSMF